MCEYMRHSIGWFTPPAKGNDKHGRPLKGKIHLEEPGWICTHPNVLKHPQRFTFVTDQKKHVTGVRIGIVCHTCKGNWLHSGHSCHETPGYPKMTAWREGTPAKPMQEIVPGELYKDFPPHPLSIYECTPEEWIERTLYKPKETEQR